jgi:hypothetical protein
MNVVTLAREQYMNYLVECQDDVYQGLAYSKQINRTVRVGWASERERKESKAETNRKMEKSPTTLKESQPVEWGKKLKPEENNSQRMGNGTTLWHKLIMTPRSLSEAVVGTTGRLTCESWRGSPVRLRS